MPNTAGGTPAFPTESDLKSFAPLATKSGKRSRTKARRGGISWEFRLARGHLKRSKSTAEWRSRTARVLTVRAPFSGGGRIALEDFADLRAALSGWRVVRVGPNKLGKNATCLFRSAIEQYE